MATDTTVLSRKTAPDPRIDAARIHRPDGDCTALAAGVTPESNHCGGKWPRICSRSQTNEHVQTKPEATTKHTKNTNKNKNHAFLFLFVFFVCFVVASLSACVRSEKKAPSDTTAVTPTSTMVVGTKIAVAHAGPPGEWQMPAGD